MITSLRGLPPWLVLFAVVAPGPSRAGWLEESPACTSTLQNGVGDCNPTLHSGPGVISSPQVVSVIWGQLSDPDLADRMDMFYPNILWSSYFDWVAAEYGSGSNVPMKRGSYLGQTIITPATTKGSSSTYQITSQDIADEIAHQISIGMLPPSVDGSTIYTVLIDNPWVRTSGGQDNMCQLPSYGYHQYLPTAQGNITYSIVNAACQFALPYQDPSVPQQLTHFDYVTLVTSHELMETITDYNTCVTLGCPGGWRTYSAKQAEIADLCTEWLGATFVNGFSFVVSKLWSNAENACVTTE